MKAEYIKKLAADNGNWKCKKDFSKGHLLIFERGLTKIFVHYDDMTVITKLWHLKSHSYTSLRREKVDEDLLKMIFTYPRVHTDKGIYTNDTSKATTSK